MKTLDSRYQQAHKEAKLAVALAFAYFLWWYGFAYGFAPQSIEHALPTLYFGLPFWFLMSCIVGPLLFTILCALMVKYLYQDMPLDIEQDPPHEQ